MTERTAAGLRALASLTGSSPAWDLGSLPRHPEALFFDWLRVAVAAGVPEPHAATLATVDADGVPDARTLILKDLDQRGWAFAGPRSSAKGSQLAVCPAAALNFRWQPLVREVRVRGTVLEASRAESAADLAARSAAARADTDTDPDDWVLWRLLASRVEFWQGSSDRRHLRVIYSRGDDGWKVSTSGRSIGGSAAAGSGV